MVNLSFDKGMNDLGGAPQNTGTNARRALGGDLGEAAEATLRLAAELRPMLDKYALAALDELVQDEKNDACRIAVIGQVKAGKSTLINALVRRPRFLPTNVNPWTAVVTNLHFGRRTDAGAVFQFFDESDWQHLAGGGRLQELSHRLGVALDVDTLASQVRLMRERAERRLGQQFRQLLGKQHRFASASVEVLERYVCIGDPEPGSSEPKLGRFADITKSADLYFDLPPFGYATTIIDTPGMNDPFLVRDELSREALRSADAYVVVLNAQQALSSSDLDLLRLLHGLRKSRLAIFVNRIDLLPNPAADGEMVAAHVRSKLAGEFPGVAIPIVVGSALQTESAMAADQTTIENRDRLRAAQPWTRRNSLRGAKSGDAISRTATTRSAGLDDLTGILARLIVRGPTMLRLQRRQNALLNMISMLDFGARSELISIELKISSARDDEAAEALRQDKAAKDLLRMNAAPEAVAKLIDVASSDLGLAKDSAVKRLGGALRDIIHRHAAKARETLLAQPRFNRQQYAWQYPTLPLRRDMEREFQVIYWSAAKQLWAIVQTVNAGILNEIGDLVPADSLVGENMPIYIVDPEPSISALGQMVAIDLDDQWRDWWRLWNGQKQRARKLEELLIAEFEPVVETLVDAAEAELSAYVVKSVQRFSQLGHDLIATLKRLKSDLEFNHQDRGERKPEVSIREYQRRKHILEEQIENCARIAKALRTLISRGTAPGPTADPFQPG